MIVEIMSELSFREARLNQPTTQKRGDEIKVYVRPLAI